jgi:hypothetical protein
MRILQTISAAALIAILTPSAMTQTGEGPERKALFGELHMHTWWSLDAYSMSTRLTPDDA